MTQYKSDCKKMFCFILTTSTFQYPGKPKNDHSTLREDHKVGSTQTTICLALSVSSFFHDPSVKSGRDRNQLNHPRF